jgi:hypothetical protein
MTDVASASGVRRVCVSSSGPLFRALWSFCVHKKTSRRGLTPTASFGSPSQPLAGGGGAPGPQLAPRSDRSFALARLTAR